jgi:hypothetical protein
MESIHSMEGKMKLNFSRLALFALLAATLLALGLAQTAPVSAYRPVREFLPADDLRIEGVCDFPVFSHVTANKEYEKIYFNKDGVQTMDIVTGVFKVKLTNLDTHKSIDLNISGSSKEHDYSDGSGQMNLTGQNLFWYFPDKSLPAMFTNSGQVQFRWDVEGNLTGTSVKGHVVDICKALE